ncbi:aspartate kinase [Irregularibacter muris]|uniref:Aspartokinase n=1 Tax=Irregularibacter muris TaxID=1796619 RepID=A0AAE3KYS6_9FIRM|nr:aspartate kinase [Irregularibacter muris]MCR1898095.1 aspartate kinase [Irregularibacter muris]
MRIIIQKFGGTSIGTKHLREQIVKKVINAKQQNTSPIVVVSAMGRKGDPYSTDTLIQLLDSQKSVSSRDLDLMMSCGEIISSVIVAANLSHNGCDAIPLTGGQAGIITNNQFGKAKITEVDTNNLLDILKKDIVPVVAGFQGITKEGYITTLGRGGSDITASILGKALQAECVEIYTDVDGIMTADPRLVPNAQVLSTVGYDEVFQLAESGAKVIHPKAVEISMRCDIPIYIRNTKNNSPGTLISHYNKIHKDEESLNVVTGIAHIYQKAQVKIPMTQKLLKSNFDSILFSEIANNNISIDLMNIFPEEKVFIIDDRDIYIFGKLMEKLQCSYTIIKNCCKLTLIGNEMRGVPGIMARIITVLSKKNIQVLQTSDSHTTISCLIKEEDVPIAIKALHAEFDLG